MSISEELRKTIAELSEEQQQELLETARHLLDGSTLGGANQSESENDTDLNEELSRRYQHLRENPDQVVSARESSKQVRSRYGWS